jgi:predicted SAM-dependent methyltransferase
MLKRMFSTEFRDRHRLRWLRFKRLFRRPVPPQNADGSLNIHLGCGRVNHPAFINVDVAPFAHIHYVHPVERLPMFPDGIADLIYVCHCLEHVSFLETAAVLHEWRRVLKPGGILRVSVPDFDCILAIYEAFQHEIAAIEKTLMGGQNYPANFHKAVFNRAHLTRLFESAGYVNIRPWTPGSDVMTTFDDWSGRSVKVQDRAFPISLNLEAERGKT